MEKAQDTRLDIELIDYVANCLKIGRFKLFKDAYAAWFGDSAADKMIEHHYNRYLTDNVVPFWVRNYVRTALSDPRVKKRKAGKIITTMLSFIVPPILVFFMVAYILAWGK